MRLTKQMKEILAYSLALRVEEMAEGSNKELVKYMLGTWQNQGIWGQEEEEEEGWVEEDAEDKHWKDVATYNERNSY
tara:strand:- start:1004 stop:1234 length:231 start_codon:yes stop_codon:yes gene_type:complete